MAFSFGDDGLMMEVEHQVEPPTQGREIVRMYRNMQLGDYIRVTKTWQDGSREVYEGPLMNLSANSSWGDMTVVIGVGRTEVEVYSQTFYDDHYFADQGSAVFRTFTEYANYHCTVEKIDLGRDDGLNAIAPN